MKRNSKLFTYIPESRQFVTDISDLGNDFRFQQVYPDACDEGFALVSDRTGRSVAYVISEVKTQGGEVYGWTLVPAIHPDLPKIPVGAVGTSVLIAND